MKKIALCIMTSVLAIGTSEAQHDIKLNMLGVVFGNYGVNYEYVISPEMSAGGAVNYYLFKTKTTGFSGEDNENKYVGFNFAPEFRFYFNPDDDAEGMYVGAYLKYRSATSDGWSYVDAQGNFAETTRSTNGLAFGILGGKKWVADAGFIFETYFGIGKYLTNNVKFGSSEYETYWDQYPTFEVTGLSAIDVRLGLGIGWRL